MRLADFFQLKLRLKIIFQSCRGLRGKGTKVLNKFPDLLGEFVQVGRAKDKVADQQNGNLPKRMRIESHKYETSWVAGFEIPNALYKVHGLLTTSGVPIPRMPPSDPMKNNSVCCFLWKSVGRLNFESGHRCCGSVALFPPLRVISIFNDVGGTNAAATPTTAIVRIKKWVLDRGSILKWLLFDAPIAETTDTVFQGEVPLNEEVIDDNVGQVEKNKRIGRD